MPRAKVTKKAGNGSKKKTTRRKTPAKAAAKPAAKPALARAKKTRTRKTKARASEISISADERRRWIAEAAYLRAESRGFVGGDPTRDWLDAEYEIDERISAHA